MSDSTRRGLRTAIQLIITILGTGGVVGILNLVGIDVTAAQWAGIVAIVLPFLTTLLNNLEDAGKIPAILKTPTAEPGSVTEEKDAEQPKD